MKTADDFKKQVKEKVITKWLMHDCSICGYHCGYYFKGDEVKYDIGCNCGSRQPLDPRTWENVAEHYNMQTDKDVIKEMDKFWEFRKEIKKESK